VRVFLFGYLWLCGLSLVVAASMREGGEALGWSRDEFAHEVQLLAVRPGRGAEVKLEYLEKQLKRPLSAGERGALSRTDEGKWKRWEDELLAMDLPDVDGMRVDVVEQGERKPLRVVGSRVGTTDNRFERAYRVTVGDGVPYVIVLVSKADGFDEGICLCGAIAFERRQMVQGGGARRFSLLGNGEVKTVQVLRGGMRAIVLEWTHTVLPQAAYMRLGASLRIKAPDERGEAEWIAATPEAAWSRAGWLKRGDDEARLRSLIGVETRREGDELIYESELRDPDGSGVRLTLRVRLPGGRFAGFSREPISEEALPPTRGSLAWAREVAKEEDEGGKKRRFSRKDRERVLGMFLDRAARAEAHEWNDWCGLVVKLHKRGVRDPRVIPVIAARYLEAGVDQHYAAWALEHYKAAERIDLFEARIRLLLREGGEKDGFDTELWNLYSFLPASAPGFRELMEDGLRHPKLRYRVDAIGHAEKLPAVRAREVAREALERETDSHARTMSAYLIRDVGGAEDLAWLTGVRDAEKNESVRKVLDEAIAEVAARAGDGLRARRGPWRK
jgi:hypothetical protein